MGTRGAIARLTNGDGLGWEGRYHHWDSYPSGLGATLYGLVKSETLGDLNATLRTLIDEHPAGWSTINGADWSQAPGFDGSRPNCYCHGTRSEDGWLVTNQNASGAGVEYAYVFDVERKHMLVLSSYTQDGAKMIGMFGMGDKDAQWAVLADVDLGGPEPDWGSMG